MINCSKICNAIAFSIVSISMWAIHLMGLALLVIVSGILTGCAGFTPGGGPLAAGGASYEYTRTPDGAITARVSSTRDLDAAKIRMSPDGTLEADLGGAASHADLYLGAIQEALRHIPVPPP